MNAGPDLNVAIRQAIANARRSGRSRWIYGYGGVWWIDASPGASGLRVDPEDTEASVLERVEWARPRSRRRAGKTPELQETAKERRRLRGRGAVRTDTHAAYRAAIAADNAYSVELRRVFGNAAGEARYDARGTSTPKLRRLSDAKVAADAAWRASL